MRQPTIFAKSVVNLLGRNYPCQVEETPQSFNCTNCLVSVFFGKGLSAPIGLFITQEHVSKPVYLQWFLRTKGSFDPACPIVYVSIAEGLGEGPAAAAIYRMLEKYTDTLHVQELKVLRVHKDGRGDFVKPDEFLSQLQAERFEKTRDRRNGYIGRGAEGQWIVKSGGSQFDVGLTSFPRGSYLRKIGQLREDEKVSFRPDSDNGFPVAVEIRFIKILPRSRNLHCCA
jgi:hypothetical protein